MSQFTGKRMSLPEMSHPAKKDVKPDLKPKPNKILDVGVFLRPNASSDELPEIAAFQDITKKSQLIISRKDFEKKQGANQNDVKIIKAFAKLFNLKVGEVQMVERWIKLSGTIKSLERAFGISIFEFKHDGKCYYYYQGIISIPEELDKVIECISGINNQPVLAKKILAEEFNVPGSTFKGEAVFPQNFAKYYDFPAHLDGSGQCIAILAFRGGFEEKHLDSYFKKIGLPKPEISTVELDGAKNQPTGGDDDFESHMDLEIAGSLAPGAKIVVYFGQKSPMGVIRTLKAAIHDKKFNPGIISMSWGRLEKKVQQDFFSKDEINTMNRVLHEAAALNITVITSSGDLGSSGGDSGLNIELPASNPFVLAVGGSQLHLKNKVIDHEDVWSEKINFKGKEYSLSSGGGFSELFETPDYQKDLVSESLNPNGKRGIPDVAANASTSPGILLQVGDTEQISLGTSAAAPLWAALIARINQHLELKGLPRAGFINPALYHKELSKSFNQVLSGSNGEYKASSGWNPCTGLGTPNGNEVLKRLTEVLEK